MRSSEIRSKFLKYFEGKGHAVLPGSSLIPKDPTVLLTVAGMLQFKPVFLGLEKSPVPRAATVQKCIRTNDLENVGRTARHHTFFEMLGNFSFGDYFKDDAIAFSWELLTGRFNLDKSRLRIAVYEKDEESLNIWADKIGISKGLIVKLGEDNNFWAAGPTGPCGPCSEIYYDLGAKFGCGKPDCAPGCDCDRFLEIWNLVFMEFNRDEKGMLSPLPKKNIDTGMGLERIASVMQGVSTNFDTDLFVPLIAKINGISHAGAKDPSVSAKIIADHVRAASFLVSDGLVPGNEGRNYVLRRIIRRAAMHGRRIGISGPFISGLSGEVGDIMGGSYPEFSSGLAHVKKVLSAEEESFGRTLETGMEMLESIIKRSSGGVISGQDAFKLYDTYGFPLEMTAEIAGERGFGMDSQGFEKAMQGQQERSKQSSKKYVMGSLPQVTGYPATEFVGYDRLESESKVLGVADGFVILDKTPFYVESGGQDSDRGWLVVEKNKSEIKQLARTADGVVLHKTASDILPNPGEKIRAIVNKDIRAMIAAHHTSTHLLHAALHKVVGKDAVQRGSFVGSDKFRMDFTSAEALKPEELKRIEDIVNDAVNRKINVKTIVTTPEEAKKAGAMALFGEKYGDSVRMIEIEGVSRELCGGTHVNNTLEIGLFKIIKESAIAQGIRRIEAVSGINAEEYVKHLEEERAKALEAEELKKKKKEEEKRQEKAIKEVPLQKTVVNGITAVVFDSDGFDPKIAGVYARELASASATVSLAISGNAVIVASSPDVSGRGFDSSKALKELLSVAGGKGGGRADFAQGSAALITAEQKISIFEKFAETVKKVPA
jgi:alanyl-tRNA synthetase